MSDLWEPKDGFVNLDGLEPQIADRLDQMAETRRAALKQILSRPMVVTSGNDGHHMTNSLHYRGLAVDLRTRDFTDVFASLLRAYLGKDYDVVVERDHLHVELDIKP